MRNYWNCNEDFPERQGIDMGKDLLNHIFAGVPGGVFIELTYILPPELADRGPSPLTDSTALYREAPDWARALERNAQGYSVYYSLCAKRRRIAPGKRSSESDAAVCSVLWVDVDLDGGQYASKDDAHAALSTFRPVPTALVDSGGGLHGLWRIHPVQVTQDTLPKLKGTLRGLAQMAGGDPHVAELARVFRLPGTINTKPKRDGAACVLLDLIPVTYRLEDFAAYALDERPRPQARITQPLPDGLQIPLPRWVTTYLQSGAPQGERNNRLFAAAVEFRVNGYAHADAVRELGHRAALDGLGDEEIQRTIDSAWRSDVGAPNIPDHMAWRIASRPEQER